MAVVELPTRTVVGRQRVLTQCGRTDVADYKRVFVLLVYPIVVGVRVLLATPLALDESLFHPPPFPLNPAPLILIPYLPPSIFFQLSSPQFLFHGSLLPLVETERDSARPAHACNAFESVLLHRVSRSL